MQINLINEVGNMKKKIFIMLISAALAFGAATVAYAGQWQQNSTGWWYQNDDSTYPRNSWQWLNGKCYYFDSNGYMLANTTTPDGYNVDANGAWTVNGVVQTQGTGLQTNTGTASGYNKDGISNVAIDLLNSSREEANAKYGPEYASQYVSTPSLSYANIPFGVSWNRKKGHEAASQENPSDMNNYFVDVVGCDKPTDMVNFLPERANSLKPDDLAKTLKSMGYDATSNGLGCMLLLGDYYIQFRNFDGDTSVLISSTTSYGRTPRNTGGKSEDNKYNISDRPIPALNENTEYATEDTNTNAAINNNKP